MSRVVLGMCLALIVPTAFSSPAFGKDNKGEVQGALNAKHEKVIYLKEIDHVDYVALLAVLPTGPAGVAAYLEELATSILKEAGGTVAKETIYDLLLGKKDDTVVGGKPVYVGIATYNHWTEERYPKINRGKVSWGTIRVPRPNTHQFYIAIGKK